MRRVAFFLAIVLSLSPGVSAKTKSKKIRGYVTNIVSTTTFEIEDYRITRDLTLVLDFEKGDSEESIDFRPEDIRIGTEVQIKGDYDDETGELQAKSIKVFLEEHKKVKRTALLEHSPLLEREGDGWVGTFFADGQRIRVQPSTKVVFKPNRSEKKALKEKEKKERKRKKERKEEQESEEGEEDEDEYARPLQSLDEIGPNTFMTYVGFRHEDGSIDAIRLEFVRNELEKGEAKLWKKLTPKIKEPQYREGKPGQLKISKVGKFKLVPSEEAQEYVRQLGESLIPPYQKSLPAGDPSKIPFQFYLVKGKTANAFALPNGVIVIFSPMFEILENETQLASVLGHEIAHSIQEHTRRQRQYHKKKLMAMRIGGIFAATMGVPSVTDILNMIEGAIRNGYSRRLENQSDRIGLEYLVAAGYDPREAPRVWKMMAKKYGDRPTNFFWSSHNNHTTRRSYLMAELRNNYADLDYSEFQANNEEEFQRIAELVKDATAKKKKKKIKVKY